MGFMAEGEHGGAHDGPIAPAVPSRVNRRSLLLGGSATAAVGVTVVVVARDTRPPPADEASLAAARESAAVPASNFDDIPGISSFNTPIGDHYVIDTAFEKPVVDPDTYTLRVGGEFVSNPLTLTYDDLLRRDLITRQLVLAGVSNPVGGDLVGNAVWTGVSLTELLDEAGIEDPTNPDHQIFSRSVDGYTAGFRVPVAYDGRSAMVALAINGEPLPVDHGFPARLLVNGLYGYTSSTKWLESIEVNDFLSNDAFWIPRGWAKEAPVKTQSRIDTPGDRDDLVAGPTTIAGVAWAPGRGVSGVEVGFASFGDPEVVEWFEAELATVESAETWVQWRYDWDAPEGSWTIQVRATDGGGVTQSETPVAPPPDGAEGFHTVFGRTV